MTKKKSKLQPESAKPESAEPKLKAAPETEAVPDVVPDAEVEAVVEAEADTTGIEDPIGDTTDGEAKTAVEAEVEPAIEAETGSETEAESESEPEFNPKPRPPAKLERLQKILAAAGVASRRSAEAMIEQGRVQVNGKIVTVLGTKADAARDHIRVDGKLLQGAERLRYFVLNKPKGFVTTVKDPEGRPTVMQFFDKMKERLYPVGRLDYMSEGLLVVTNDGELANKLTKASSGVEKTYLVKVAGQPTEAELDILRGGVAIERGKPGSGQVRTSPARIRQVRQGDNPWYEVVLIEGRNRELRKMFEEVGHFVEKIRRVGYGPLVLDQEPGNLRELEPEELSALRLAAEGKLRTPKSKELRRRNLLDAGPLPTVRPKPSGRPRVAKPFEALAPAAERPSGYQPKKFAADRPSRPAGSFDRSANKPFRPAWKKDDRPARPPSRFAAGAPGENRPGAGRPFTAKPAWKKPERPGRPERNARPAYQRPAAPRREARVFDEDLGPVRPPNLHIEEIAAPERTSAARPSAARSNAPRPYSNRPSFERPASSARPAAEPFRREGGPGRGLARPFTTSSGKPRPGGARPSNKSGKFAKTGSFKPESHKSGSFRPYGTRPSGRPSTGPARRPFRSNTAEGSFAPRPATGSGSRTSSASRPYTPRAGGASDYRPTKAKPYPSSASRAQRKAGPGWKPKPSFGGPGKSASGPRSKSRPGGMKRTGPRPGGKPGGKRHN